MKYECLKLEERRIIEAMYAEGAKAGRNRKARRQKCRATIYRELERGQDRRNGLSLSARV